MPRTQNYGQARLARIYPLYFVLTVALAVTYRAGLPPNEFNHDYALAVVANLFLVQAWGLTGSVIYPAWSISTELVAYLLFPVFLVMLTRWRFGPWISAVAAGATYVFLALSPTPHTYDLRHGPLDISWVGSWEPVLRCCAGFLLGMATYRLLRDPGTARRLQQLPLATLAALVMLLSFLIHGADIVFVTAAPLLVAGLATGRDITARFLAWTPVYLLGEWSYAIYLLHCQAGLFFYGANGLLGHFLPHEIAVYGTPFLALGALIGASWLTFEFFEKPARRALRRLDSRRKLVVIGADSAAP